MRRFLRYLRIAFSIACLVACVLLIVLWVRSHQRIDYLFLAGHKILAVRGEIQIDRTWSTWAVPTGRWYTGPGDSIETLWKTREVQVRPDTGLSLPFWWPTISLLALSVVPWIRWRFSLRTLLIATTLVAMVLGLIVAVLRWPAG
jgi:hypothetical protein